MVIFAFLFFRKIESKNLENKNEKYKKILYYSVFICYDGLQHFASHKLKKNNNVYIRW